jgi:hypothetical protein
MRIALILSLTAIGVWVGAIVGEPRLYWHGDPSETVTWAWYTGGFGAIGALFALLVPFREQKKRLGGTILTTPPDEFPTLSTPPAGFPTSPASRSAD